MKRIYKLLVVEDTPDDAELISLALRSSGLEAEYLRVETAESLRAALNSEAWDAVLSDYNMPGFSAKAALAIVREFDADLPLIVVSGTIGEALAVDMMQEGANDYVLKQALVRLGPAIEREVREAAIRRSKKESERVVQQLAAVVDSSSDAILCVDPERHITFWNRGAEKLFGYAPEQIIGKRGYTLVPPERLAEASARIERVLRGESLPAFETARLRSDGTQIPVSATISAIRVDGRIVGASGIYRDITAQKDAEAQLLEARVMAEHHFARLRTVVDTMAEGLIVADYEGNLLDWNATALRIHGLKDVREVQKPLSWFANKYEISPPVGQALPQSDWPLAKVLRGESFFGWELRIRDLSLDTEKVFSYSGAPVRESDGEIILAVLTMNDVTEQKRGERELLLFRTLIDKTSDGIEVIDPKTGRFIDVNERSWVAHGYTRKEYLDLKIQDIDPSIASRSWESLAEGGQFDGPQLFESLHRRKDGTIFPVEIAHDLIRLDREYIVAVVRDITARKRAEADLRLRDRAIGAATQGITITEPNQPDDPLIYVSPSFQRITGYESEEILGQNCRFLQGKDTDPAAVKRLRDSIRAGEPCTVELLNYRKDGTPFWNELSISPVRETDGTLTNFVGVMSDVTARRNLEEQFRQAQKMEAVGQLAGGVAHDFNNMLTIINGYSDILLQSLPFDDPAHEMIAEIFDAGQRSAGLTRQLLAFSRKQLWDPRVLYLNEIVKNTEKLLRRLIGEDIQLLTSLEPQLGFVRADPGQLEQVIVNLAVNARDAMTGGGKLTIQTRNVDLEEEDCKDCDLEISAGPYVLFSMTDTGCGMSPEIRAKIFEPFFTTKGPGKGTGLGLATVFGIVKQSSGCIAVHSEVGVGTSFEIYLPRVEAPSYESKFSNGHKLSLRGTETILLVEDEAAVRSFTYRVLTENGYTVLEAVDGDDAVRIAEEYEENLHLILTDVVLPGIGGRSVAEKVAESHPEAKVMYLSGYTDDAVIRHGILREGVPFLQKPFTPSILSAKVREVLDA